MSWLIYNFKKFDSQIAIIYNDKKYTYKDLLEKIQKFLNDFKDRVKEGEVVAILGNYSFENIALLLALYESNNIIVPITSIKKNEIKEANCDETIKIEDLGFRIEL